MKKYVIGLFFVMIFLLAASSALAITTTICSPKIVAWYYNVPASVTKSMCIQNDNAYPATVYLSASSDISGMISFSQTQVTLAVGEKKYIPFTVSISQETLAIGSINARFVVPQDTSGFPDMSGTAAFSTKKGACQTGATQACMDGNCTGTETCSSDFQWGTCVKTSPSCGGGGTGCTESWSCGSWSPSQCTAGTMQSRTCTDANSCGTTVNKPLTLQECSGTSCTESWSCGDWSLCSSNTQSRTCADSNNCGTTTSRPAISQSCNTVCHPNWECTWSSCQPSGTKTGTNCHDTNNCGLACTTANDCVTSTTCTYNSGGGGGGGSSGGGGGGGGGGSSAKSETQSIPLLEPGKAGVATFAKSNDLHIKEVYITLNNKSTGAQITVKEANIPLGAIAPTEGGKGKVVDYLQISRSNIPADALEKVTFKFTVNKAELSRLNFSVYDVRLVRYLETQKIWQKLNTSFVKEDADFAYYSADSPGFSTFAVITEQGASAPPAAQNRVNTTATAVKNTTDNKSGTANAPGTAGATANANSTDANEPSAATGMAIKELPKSPMFMGVLILVLVIAIIVIVIKTTGGKSIEIR